MAQVQIGTEDQPQLRIPVNSTTTEYIVAGGQLLAERQASGDWSDYVYVNGRLIVKGDSYHDRLHTHGTNSCGNCGEWTAFAFPNAAGYNGYVIRNGDKLFLRQWQASGSQGGMIISFSDGTNTSWSVMDQNGTYMNQDTSVTTWDYRRFDLSSFAGKTISAISLVTEASTQAGNWDIYYSDIALFSADGTVRPIYNRETSISLSVSGASGVTNISYGISRVSGVMPSYDTTTNYYHSDQIGSGRMVSNVNGYPVWQATYTPFGYEYNEELGINRLKFATYQRDSESGLDYAKFRFYNPQMNRFMSPDPAGLASAEPSNPQSWNRYAYTLNDPLSSNDPFGLDCQGTIDNFAAPGLLPGSVTTTGSGACPSDASTVYMSPTLNIFSSAGTGLYRPNEEYAPWPDGRRGGSPQRSTAQKNSDVRIYGIYGWGQQILSHPTLQTTAATMTDPRTYALWTGASAVAGTAGWVVYDYNLGPAASQLFGKDLFQYAASNGPGLLNNPANTMLRIGFGWVGPETGGAMWFRVSGSVVSTVSLSGSSHWNLWTVPWP